jgi:hypothetical protein
VSAVCHYLKSMPFAARFEELLRELDHLPDDEVVATADRLARDYRATEAERDRILALGLVLEARGIAVPSGFAAVLGEALRGLEKE